MNDNRETYWNDIPVGKENATNYEKLCQMWDMNERNVRRTLHDLSSFDNGDDYILIRSGSGKGFYRTDDRDEIAAYKRECLNKGRSIFAPIRKINRVLSANCNQFTLTNNMRVMREAAGMRQKDVCERMQERGFFYMDVPTLSKMENGVCLPTGAQLAYFAEIYACAPSDIIPAELYSQPDYAS